MPVSYPTFIHAFKGNILIGARHELEVAQFTLIADL